MNVADGTQLWGDQYNQPHADLLAVQEEIASEILDKLRPRLSGRREEARDPAATPKTPRRTSCTCRAAITGTRARSPATRRRSSTSSRRSTRTRSTRSPMPGWPTRTCCSARTGSRPLTEAKARRRCRRCSSTRNLAEAHVALGHIKLWLDWDWPAAETRVQAGHRAQRRLGARAQPVRDVPGDARPRAGRDRRGQARAGARPALAHRQQRPRVVSALRRPDGRRRSRSSARRSSSTRTRCPRIAASASRSARRAGHDEAIDELKRALDLSENSPVVLGHLGAAYARAGRKARRRGRAEGARRPRRPPLRAVVGHRDDLRRARRQAARARLAAEGVRRARLRDRADRRGALVSRRCAASRDSISC